MKYTPQTPAPRHWSWEDTAPLREADVVVMDCLLTSSEGNFRQWIHAHPEAAAEALLLCLNQYHVAIEKFLS
jgi:hypothetical protein